ncbi:MAG: DUF4339 domain-containing protein [Thermoguttaceae bacterium]|nr:DUF4339 domain-containing protein [Thermoguttaceae bacterium]
MWYFFDQLNRRQGPVNDAQLKALADHGVISPGTLIETDTGKRGTASQIPRLFPSGAAKKPGSSAAPKPKITPEAVTTAFDSSNPFTSGASDTPEAMKAVFDSSNPFTSGAFDMPEAMKAALGSKSPVVSGMINVSGAPNAPLDPKTPIVSGVINFPGAPNASFDPKAPIASGLINFPGGIEGINITSKTVTANSPDGKTRVSVTIAAGTGTLGGNGIFMGADHWLYRSFYFLLHLGLLVAAYFLLKGPLHHFGEFELEDILTILVRIALLVALRYVLLACLRYGFRFYASLCKGLFSGKKGK